MFFTFKKEVDMKTLLIAINAKYEHEGPAVWYLKQACLNKGIPARVLRFSINDSLQRIWAAIMEEQPDVAAFSCYIWNRELVIKLISDIKKARPGCSVIVGGPEVSYEGAEKDFFNCGADHVIKGEGESKLPRLLKAIEERDAGFRLPDDTEGACSETGYISPICPEYLSLIKDRIAYIESSRGCPYRCSYCLSSASRGFILYPPDEIEADIRKLVDAGAKVIKFVDRSFNVNEKHALAIWAIVRKFSGRNVTFHFEVNADILSDAQIESLLSMPAGLIQIEAGIQSVKHETLKEISRVMDVDKAVNNLKIIMGKGNIHVHTDLIAGLPFDDPESFKESFNRIYDIKAHHLQLGFLKLLHGTRIRLEAEKHGYKYREYPPYEVIENRYISAEEMLVLKGVEEMLDRTWNSGRLWFTLDYLADFFESPFDLYNDLALCFKEKGRLYQPISAENLFKLIREFSLSVAGIDLFTLDSCLAADYVCSLKIPVIPEFLSDSGVKALDGKDILETLTGETWRKEHRKRILVLSGSFPAKIFTRSLYAAKGASDEGTDDAGYLRTDGVKHGVFGNKMIVDPVGYSPEKIDRVFIDVSMVDPVTGRAVPEAIL
jgi:radical SAM superfamily enzyme YgiQ (UPF0313 family)